MTEEEGWGDNWGDPEETAKDIYDLGHPEKAEEEEPEEGIGFDVDRYNKSLKKAGIDPNKIKNLAPDEWGEEGELASVPDEDEYTDSEFGSTRPREQRAKEYDPLGEPDLMSKDEKKVGDYFDNLGEAPDDIEQTFGKAEEYDVLDPDEEVEFDDEPEKDQTPFTTDVNKAIKRITSGEEDVSVSGPPANTQPPANMFDDEEDEEVPINESIENILNEAEFREEDHPRDGGKFTSKGGGDSGSDEDAWNKASDELKHISVGNAMAGKTGIPDEWGTGTGEFRVPNWSEMNKEQRELLSNQLKKDSGDDFYKGVGDKPKDKPKGRKFTMKQFRKNEDENEHGKNDRLLVKQYGTPEELEEIEAIAKRNPNGFSGADGHADYKRRYDISQKYYDNLEKEFGESYAQERDFYTSNKQIDDQAWEIMAEEEFGKSVAELNDAQYDWIDQIMNDYGNNLDRSKKPSSESDIESENLDDAEMWIGAYDTMGMSVEDINNKLKGMAIPNDTIKKAWDNYKLNPTKNRNFESRGEAKETYIVKGYDEETHFAHLSDLDEATKLAEKLHAMVVNEETAEIMYVSPIFGTGADSFESAREAKLKAGYIQCPHCDQQFSNVQWLSDHINELHEGKEAKASESVTSWWGGKSSSSLEFRSKVLARAGYTGVELIDKEFWELPDGVQDKVFELYSGGYVGEAKAKEDWYDIPNTDYNPEVLHWGMVNVDTGEDWGFQTNNKAEAQRAVDDWNSSDQGYKVKLVSHESYANENEWDNTGIIKKQEILYALDKEDTDAFTKWENLPSDLQTQIVRSGALESRAKEFQPERQGKRVKIIGGGNPEFIGKSGVVAGVSVFTDDSVMVRLDGIHNEYQSEDFNTTDVEFLGGEAEPSGYYGYGSATGRMPPPEDWKQGGAMYKPSSSMFSDFRNAGLSWNELPTDVQDAWKSERDYMVNEEVEGEAIPESDVEELSKLNQLYKNEEEEQAQGEDETEDLELVSDLMDMELEEIGTEEFREDEHPRDHGKFTTKGGGDSERNKILDDPSSSKQEREDAEKGLGKKEDVPTSVPKKEPKKEEPKYSHTKPNNPKRFNTIKSRVLKALGEPKDDWGKRYTDRVEKLEGFPTSGYQLEDLSVKYKAPILKAHLMDQHPNTKWSVKSEHFSGGSAVDAGYKGGEYPYGASQIGDVYSQRGAGYDSQTDYFPIDNYTHVYDQRENQPKGDPQTIAKDRPDRLWSWVNLKFDEENEYDMGRQWSRHIAEDIIKGKGDTGGGYQGVSDEMMSKVKQVYKDFIEQERKEKAGESYAKEGQGGTYGRYDYMLNPEHTDITTCIVCGRGINDHSNPSTDYRGMGGTSPETDHYFLGGDQGGSDDKYDFESFKKKLNEFEDSDRPVSPNSLMRYTEPIDLPTGKNAMDQTYGTSEPETPDGQDLTGITVGEEEIIEKKPYKPVYHYYKQHPFGRRAGKQNPFGEAYTKEVSFRVMNRAHQWWDEKYPDRPWADMRIGERQNVMFAFLRDPTTTILGDESYAEEFDSPLRDQYGNPLPTPEGDADCTFCGKKFDNWDLLGDHITIVHNDQGRTREFYDGEAPSSILNHPDWTGYAGEGGQGSGRKPYASLDPERKDKAHVGWKNYGIDDYLEKAEKEYEDGEEGRWDYVEGDNGEQEYGDDLKRARTRMEAEKELLDTSSPTYPIKGGMDYQEGGEQFEDPTPWASLAHLGATTVKDILFPEKEESKELSLSDMTDEEMEELGKKESEPHQAEEDYKGSECNICGLDEDEHNENTGHEFTPAIIAEEGGKGSGKKGHSSWMRAIEEDHTYDFCENCSMITEQVNNKCDMCGKQVSV